MFSHEECKVIRDNQLILRILAEIYRDKENNAYVTVARLCDEVFDKSGNLLGKVRDMVLDNPKPN
jgi:hypothetical protein